MAGGKPPNAGSSSSGCPGLLHQFLNPVKAKWLAADRGEMVADGWEPTRPAPPPRWRCCTFSTFLTMLCFKFLPGIATHPGMTTHPTGMPATVGGSPATVASIAFASRQFLSDLLGSSGVVQSGAVAGPGAELMAAQAEEQRCVSGGGEGGE